MFALFKVISYSTLGLTHFYTHKSCKQCLNTNRQNQYEN